MRSFPDEERSLSLIARAFLPWRFLPHSGKAGHERSFTCQRARKSSSILMLARTSSKFFVPYHFLRFVCAQGIRPHLLSTRNYDMTLWGITWCMRETARRLGKERKALLLSRLPTREPRRGRFVLSGLSAAAEERPSACALSSAASVRSLSLSLEGLPSSLHVLARDPS